MLTALHDIVAGFVRRTWLVALTTIVCCAIFAARAMAAFGGAQLEPSSTHAPAEVEPVRAQKPAAQAKRDGAILVERNIFCSACTPRQDVAGATNPSSAYSGQPAILIATSLGASPRATVRVISTEAQGSWGLGEKIPGVGKISRIGNSTIDVVDDAGHTGQLSLVDASAGSAGRDAAAAATAKPAAPASPFAGRIEKVTDTSYKVDRELIRELVMGTTQAKGVRAMPVMKNGQIHGLRLTGIKSDSIAAAVGIKSGDVFDSIDGVKIKNAQQLLDLITKLDSVSQVELSGTRANKPLAMQYQLR